MEKRAKFYKCSICGKIIDIIDDTGGDTICCGKPMEELTANTVEASTEKHLPAAEIDGDTIKVKIGTVEHPMVDEHYIKWISVISANRVQRVSLSPHQKPEAVFVVPETGDVEVYEYCNLHGLWKTTLKK